MNFVIRPHGQAAANPKTWDYCVRVATSMVLGNFKPIANYTHYYAHNKCNPDWASKLTNRKKIGNHTFGVIV